MSDCILKLAGIEKKFTSGEETLSILKGVNFEIKKGETIAITGPSGSGKSTLLGLMAGLDRPTTGEIFFEGTPIHKWSEDNLAKWRREFVGFIFQNFRLVKTLSALENVALPLEILGYDVNKAQEQAMELLQELSMDKRASHFPHQLSGGEQQRVAIARAYAHQPKIIFADEPTGSIDAKNSHKVLHSLLNINEQRQTTLVVVTHDSQMADKLQRHCKLEEGIIL